MKAADALRILLDEPAPTAEEVEAFVEAHPPLAHVSVAFVPPPPVPAPPPQDWPHASIVRRSIAGDDGDAVPHRPGLRGFLAAMAASGDWGVPVRSSSDPDRFGKGALHGGGGRPHDPHTGREHYALAERELARIADGLPVKTTRLGVDLDGQAQLAIWCTVRGPGKLTRRLIQGVKGRGGKAGKALAQPASALVTVPDRQATTSTDVALELRVRGVDLTPHEVGLICRRVHALVEAAFVNRGWVRARTRVEQASAKEASVALPNGYDVEGWKEIGEIVGRGREACAALARRPLHPLPVRWYLGKAIARRTELQAWIEREVRAA